MDKFAYKKYFYPHECYFSGRIFDKTLGSVCVAVLPNDTAHTLYDKDFKTMFINAYNKIYTHFNN